MTELINDVPLERAYGRVVTSLLFINSNASLHLGEASPPTIPNLHSFIEKTLPDFQSHAANKVHNGWQNGMDASIHKDFSKAHTEFQLAADANPDFQAAKDLAVYSLNLEQSTTSSQSGASNTMTIAGVSITLWQLVIAIVILLPMVLLMITLLLGRSRRRSLKSDLLEADRQATIEARQIAEMKVAQRAKAQKLLDEQIMHPSLVLVPAQPAASRLPCPRCGELVPRDVNYCSNCRLMLSPPRASVHLPIPPQMATRSIVPSPSMPQLPIVAPVPVVSPAASSQTKPIEELKTPPDKNNVQIESSSKKSVSDEQPQSNLVERPSKLINRRLGNYRLIRLLGNGGFADVYLGEHVYLKKHAAIKVQQIRLTKEAIKGFLDEARTIAGLDHPHIIRILDFGVEGEELDLEQSMLNVEGSTPFLVMDYASGGSLRQRHPKGSRLSLDTVISYIGQVAEALQYAHQKRLIHRDIKPENMLIGSHDEILLSDFGIAVVAHSEHSMTTQQMAGTLPYMAPEQIQRKPQPASDQYSLGVVVYEWLSGSRPFQGSSEWEIMNQHLFAPPPSLRENNPTIPQEVEQVVLKALSKDLRQRFDSVADFARALASAR